MSGWGPFKGIARPREVFAWGMYDLANQSFQLLINTLLFPIYLGAAIASSKEAGDKAWIIFVAAATGLALLVSPLIGAIADARAWKRELLIGTGLMASALTCLLTFLGASDIWLAGAIYIAAAFCVGLGENFLGSFLPELAPPEQMGRISAIGWTMSYIGALGLVGLTFLVIEIFEADKSPQLWRWMFLVAGLWFFVGMLPAIAVLRERARPLPAEEREGLIRDMVVRLARTAGEVRRFRQLARFFIVFFVYSLGTYTVIYYAAKIGEKFGFGIRELSLLALVMSATAGVGAVLAAKYQDRIGRVLSVRLFLIVWIISTGALAYMSHINGDRSWFWAIACGVGLGLGGIGTCSRAVVGAFTPPERSGEFFGLWGMVLKLSALVGPGSFGAVSAAMGQTRALYLLLGFFVAGLLLLGFVNEREGIAAAHQRTTGGESSSDDRSSASTGSGEASSG